MYGGGSGESVKKSLKGGKKWKKNVCMTCLQVPRLEHGTHRLLGKCQLQHTTAVVFDK